MNRITSIAELEPVVSVPELLGRMVVTGSSDEAVDESFYEIVEPLREELRAAGTQRQQELEETFKSGLDLRELFKDPYQTVVERSMLLGYMYEDRSVHRTNGSLRTSQFATRNYDRTGVDMEVNVHRREGAEPWVTIHTKMQNQLDDPCTISAIDGELSVTAKAYARGGWNDVPLSTAEGGRGRHLLKALFADMVYVVDLRSGLTVPGMRESDIDARQLLMAHNREQITLSPLVDANIA